ncbi:MAG: hypothetical protein Q9174_006784, partial [Haloplaca sp. 1 TL-2023]
PLKDFINYESTIDELAFELRTQASLLRDALADLIISFVGQSEVGALLSDPGSIAWREEHLTAKLKERLQGSDYEICLKIAHRLYSTLEDFTNKIGLDTQGQPKWADAHSHKRHWKRFRTCLARKEHEVLLAQMGRDNQNLRTLVTGSVQKELVRSRQQRQTKTFNEVRNHAASLHKALRSGLLCDCSAFHHAHLRLEWRDCSQQPCFRMTFPINDAAAVRKPLTWHEAEIKTCGCFVAQADPQTPTPSPTNKAVQRRPASVEPFERPQSHRSEGSSQSEKHLEIRSGIPMILQQLKKGEKKRVAWAVMPGMQATSSVSHSTDPSSKVQTQPSEQETVDKTKLIDNLCYILRNSNGQPKTCLGRMVDEQCYYELIALSRHTNFDSESVTLHDLLTRNQCAPWATTFMSQTATAISSVQQNFYLSKKTRLQLAVTLASTALQLHTTPWLDSRWDSKCIRFRKGSLDHPYIAKSFPEPPPQTSEETNTAANSAIRNRSLFGLGILLLELSVGKPLDLCKDDKEMTLMNRYILATQLIQYLRDEENAGYFQAVQACLFCNFGTKAPEMDLESDSFRRAVYEDVVAPLEREAEAFDPKRWQSDAGGLLPLPT